MIEKIKELMNEKKAEISLKKFQKALENSLFCKKDSYGNKGLNEIIEFYTGSSTKDFIENRGNCFALNVQDESGEVHTIARLNFFYNEVKCYIYEDDDKEVRNFFDKNKISFEIPKESIHFSGK